MIYNALRSKLRETIIRRNVENSFQILLDGKFKEELREVHEIVYKDLNKNKFDNKLIIKLVDLETGFYQTSYETIAGIDFTAADMGLKSHKTTSLNVIEFEKEMFPHNLIIRLENIAETKGRGVASQQKTEFEITREIITLEKYQKFFEGKTKPVKTDYASELARKMYELHNILHNARRELITQYIEKIY
jgi:hypothetical protein